MSRIVLIVEDEVLVGMMLARKIEEFGFTVCGVVTTGEEGLEVAEREKPGVILMDISLGGEIDGIETARQVMERLDIPVVFFTGYNRDDNLMAMAEEVKALAVIDKLGPVEDLVEALAKGFNSNLS